MRLGGRRSHDAGGAARRRLLPRRRHLRIQLRARITLAFSFGALALCALVAAITYFSARSTIIGQFVNAAAATTHANAVTLASPSSDTADELKLLTSADTGPLVCKRLQAGAPCQWNNLNPYFFVSLSPPLNPPTYKVDDYLPPGLQTLVQGGQPGQQTFVVEGTTFLAVGIPINPTMAFFQVFPTSDVTRTLHILLAALLLAALTTTLAGAVLGRWAARRVLRPLTEASAAAQAIANGLMTTRLRSDDASDLAVLASSFNQMVDRVQQRIEREARFTSDVAHELRSPLTTLVTSLSVIEARRDDLPERSQRALALLSDEVRRFQRMVGDLLEISRFDAGVVHLDENLVTVGELVHNALGAAGAATLPVSIDPATATRYLVVDKRRVERIITNIVENAERHAGGATGVTVAVADEMVQIAIEDHGPGVEASERERIFQRFARGSQTARSRGSGRGTGLGLALVTEHAKLHGGRVFVEDAEGGGARFVLELPLAVASEEDDGLADDEDAAGGQPESAEGGDGAPPTEGARSDVRESSAGAASS